MAQNTIFRKIIAMVLCLTMVFGSVPATFALEEDKGYDQVADADTINEWQDFFGKEFANGSLSTENAGLVWTDKSVYTSEEAPSGVDIADNNFLVALSAMASNKEIVGYSAIPTDSVFILDLSESMDDGKYVPDMVEAANEAIRELLSLNNHNRVSVIVYSGNSNFGDSNINHATVLLPLGRYVEYSGNGFIRYSGKDNSTTVSIASGLKDGNNHNVKDASKTTIGGTYIQSGLYLAYKEFEKVKNDTVIDSGLIQGGTTRMPIITLMSDGRPTTASTYYSDLTNNGNNRNGTSTHGNGGDSNNTITFLTQLTAAYLKASVKNWYEGSDVKFYSLWLKGKDDNTANGTLQPSNSNDTLDNWWKTFLSAEVDATIPYTERLDNADDIRFSITRDGVIPRITRSNYKQYGETYEEAWLAQQNYIDGSFTADDDDGLKEAFDDIVDEIILQSRYYPTLVDGGDHDTDGYITIEDPLGEFMEVKQIEGIMLAVGNSDILFTGAALTRYMKQHSFGDNTTYTENGWALIRAIEERLGVNESTAIALATQAWNTEQLSYTSDTEFSNYIGWYCDENRKYMGFWQEDHDADDVPVIDGKRAKKYVKSYGFFGELGEGYEENNLYGTQMLHIVVHVATDLDDGDQMIYFSVPASLVPVMTYSVGVNSNSLESATTATVKLTGATGPIRLLAEVGLRDDINEITVAEIVEERHHHTENGNYVFYTNRWGTDNNHEPTESSIIQFAEVATTSHYQPSVQNDRYYYTEDAIIYTDTKGTKYSGNSKPENGDFYHIIYRFDNV